jgi:folate-binding protein YgfZ
MTEQLLQTASATLPVTPLTDFLRAQSPDLTLMAYRGVLTLQHLAPQHLDAPAAETDALLHGAAVHDLGWLRRVAVRGEDRYRWLSGMVTNAVETLADGAGAYNLVLNAQGRIQGDGNVWRGVWRDGDDLELEIAAEQSEALLAHLDHFIIMDDVELIPLAERSALGISGPDAGRLLAGLGLPAIDEEMSSGTGTIDGFAVRLERGFGPLAPHYVLWADAGNLPSLWEKMVAAGAKPVGAAALETLRIVEGIPAYGIDIQSRDLAQETSQTRALNFTKGCYLGQEIVERIRSRGQVHRHLLSLELILEGDRDLPAAGTELKAAEKAVGTLTSVAAMQLNGVRRIFGIGMIRAEAEAAKLPLSYSGGQARILNTGLKLTAV